MRLEFSRDCIVLLPRHGEQKAIGVTLVPENPRRLHAVESKDEVMAVWEAIIMCEVRHHKLKNNRAMQKIGLDGFDPCIV